MKKIMFNDRYGLTKAVLKGRKTMTRRVIPAEETKGGIVPISFWSGKWCGSHGRPLKRQPFEVGEVVAVAQKYKDFRWPAPQRSDFQEILHSAGWNNKMFVKTELMPHRIRITNVRVERLQDISDEDCLREGVYRKIDANKKTTRFFGFNGSPKIWLSPREAFAALIDKVSGKGTFDSNPWVFVYEFELIKE